MAKKTQKHAAHAKHEAPAKKKEGSSIGWIIAAIVVIIIVAFLVMQPSSNNSAQNNNNAAPSQPNMNASATTTTTASAAPAMDNNCTATIGIVPGTRSVANNVLTAMFLNNGHLDIQGTYFEFRGYNTTQVLYQLNNGVIPAGNTTTYTLDLNAVATQLGAAVRSVVLYPIQDTNACYNQKVVVINYQ
jgi:cytoskeletal protein RodZ